MHKLLIILKQPNIDNSIITQSEQYSKELHYRNQMYITENIPILYISIQ